VLPRVPISQLPPRRRSAYLTDELHLLLSVASARRPPHSVPPCVQPWPCRRWQSMASSSRRWASPRAPAARTSSPAQVRSVPCMSISLDSVNQSVPPAFLPCANNSIVRTVWRAAHMQVCEGWRDRWQLHQVHGHRRVRGGRGRAGAGQAVGREDRRRARLLPRHWHRWSLSRLPREGNRQESRSSGDYYPIRY
jgi:hypothetical protein